MKAWSPREELLQYGKGIEVDERADDGETIRPLLIKARVLLQMEGLFRAFPEDFVRKILHTYIVSYHVDNCVSGLLDNSFYYEDELSQPTAWFNRLMGTIPITSIWKQDWPTCFFTEDCIGAFQECHGSNTMAIGRVMVALGALYPDLRTMVLCGLPDSEDQHQEWENADDMVPFVNALAATNPDLTALDMDNTPTNDNVVNAVSFGFRSLLSFSATTGVLGAAISAAALDALRETHAGIMVTIRNPNHADIHGNMTQE
jgi:hypothetical protein